MSRQATPERRPDEFYPGFALIGNDRPRRNVLPGLRLSLGVTLLYIGLIVVLPLAALVFKAAEPRAGGLLAHHLVRALLKLSGHRAFGAPAPRHSNLFFDFALAWVLTRYRFPGWRLIRCDGRSAVRAADGSGRHRSHDAVYCERLVRLCA